MIDSQLKAQDVGFEANIIENHDEPRGASTYLPEYAQNPDGTKMLATVTILLRGIPFIYQGQEIGMRNCRMDGIEEYDDLETKNQYQLALKAGFDEKEALKICFRHSRDNARTPMQWSSSTGGGFTTGTPWLKMNPEYTEINVKEQQWNPDSVLSYYKQLLALRKSDEYRETLTYGRFATAYEGDEKVFAFFREDEKKKIWIGTNFGEHDVTVCVPAAAARVLLTNKDGVETGVDNQNHGVTTFTLKPSQAVVAELF